MAYYEVYIPNETEPRIYTAVRRLRNLPEGTIIWRNMESERYPVQVCNGRAKILRRKSATPSNKRVQRTGGESAANLSLFPAEGNPPAKVTAKSTRR